MVLCFIICNNFHLGICIKNTHLEGTIWRHDECSILTNWKKRCKKCNLMFPYFRTYKKRLSQKNKSYYVGSVLTPRRRNVLSKILKRTTKMVKKSIKR